ncbi:MAG: ATP-binding cassette domain-containing protein [Butyrivibrio sp.]|nr:ATP-binding cassette domain-containing protein [Butyrivibrio sp.]
MDNSELLFNIQSQLVPKLLNYVLLGIGYMKIFTKCGVKGFWAWIPVAREYHIALCADREKEGRTYTILAAFGYAVSLVSYILQNDGISQAELPVAMIVTLMAFTLFITMLVYLTRIYNGLVKVFNRKKFWVPLLLVLDSIVAPIWGFSKKFQPTKKVVLETEADGAKVAGVDAAVVKDGLTVNIKDRTVIDFFRKRYLLKDIHMSIPKGHMVLLLGGSGAGKTTYVNAVTGYEKADASIVMDGRNVYAEYDRMKYKLGFVPQQDLMRSNDTVQLTLMDAASLRLPSSVHRAEKRKRVQEVLEQFGLTAVKNSLVEKLSGGQRKRLSIAMEFISDPDLFILDEPDSGLDGVVARSLFEKLRAIADQGKIVIVITHTPDRVIDLFDDVIVLAKDKTRTGRLAWYGPVQEAYAFFGKNSMEEILLSINQKEEGGEGRANEFVEKYIDYTKRKVG